MDDDAQFEQRLRDHMSRLPQVVQDAIESAEVTEHLQQLASSHKLHLDQWQELETQVQYTLLGIQPIEDLEKNIKAAISVPDDTAHALAEDISRSVFEPIRQQMERQLAHPEAKAEQLNSMEAARSNIIEQEHETESAPTAPTPPQAAPSPVPATPPPPKPEGTAVRTPVSATYISGAPSHERPSIDGDPYREQIA